MLTFYVICSLKNPFVTHVPYHSPFLNGGYPSSLFLNSDYIQLCTYEKHTASVCLIIKMILYCRYHSANQREIIIHISTLDWFQWLALRNKAALSIFIWTCTKQCHQRCDGILWPTADLSTHPAVHLTDSTNNLWKIWPAVISNV